MTMTLRRFVERASEKIEEIFNRTGEVRPMYHIVVGTEHIVVPAPPLPKDAAVEIMKVLLEKSGAHRYVFIDEAWLATDVAPPGATIADMQKRMKTATPPAERPDRKEVVMFMAEDATEGFFNAIRVITRDADGKGTLGPLICNQQPDVVMGRMTGLLPATGTMQ
jgi:hypothetical protein